MQTTFIRVEPEGCYQSTEPTRCYANAFVKNLR
jgi:hypothetical protein